MPRPPGLRYGTSMSEQTKPFQLETALETLEALVTNMESGKLSLEEALGCFEHGMQLSKACQQALADAEQKVKVWSEAEDTLREGYAPPGPLDL